MMPLVTVFPTPNGFPIARTSSPTLMLLDSADSIGFKPSNPLIFNTAMSEYLSAPINTASVISPSLNSTKTDVALVSI